MEKNNKIIDFKKQLKYVMEILVIYKTFSFKLDYYLLFDFLEINFINKDNLIEMEKICKKFVDTIDAALNELTKEEKKLIEHIYIKNLSRCLLPYSTATFYNKRNRIIKKLYILLSPLKIQDILILLGIK